jgi:rhodanese-related sulfurtransferase
MFMQIGIRSPEEFSKYAIAGSINIDLCTLRIQFTKLPKEQSYIVCSDSPVDSALGRRRKANTTTS